MILHIGDDGIFIDVAIEQFEEVAPQKNVYLINIPTKEYKVKHIKNLDKVSPFPYNSLEYKNILNEKYDAILFHNLSKYKLKIIKELSKNNYIHWFSWGFDIYYVPKLKRKLLLPETKKIAHNNELITFEQKLSLLFPFFWNLFNFIFKRDYSIYYMLKKCSKKINSVSTVVDIEYDLITKHLNKNITYLPYNYGSIEYLFNSIDKNLICSKNDILVGNSASLENNHIDTFELIKMSIRQEIFVPLSYGNKKYTDIISAKGKIYFGDKFHPIYDFLPRNEYVMLLQRCGIVVMNHLRQQAMGNIIISLYLGAKVYLQPTSPSYIYLRKNEIKVFNINSFQHDEEINFESLAAYNRPKLLKIYGKDNILKMTGNLYKNICMIKT